MRSENDLLKDGPSASVVLDEIAHTWSFSRYKVWKTCQERYVREYIMGRRMPMAQKPFFQGKVAHNLVELGRKAYTEGATDNLETWCLDNLDQEFDTKAQKIPDWGPIEIDLARQEAKSLAIKYAAMVTENGLLEPGVECEYNIGTYKTPLKLSNGLRLTGFIDWLKIARPEGQVLDAKTYKSAWWLDKDQLTLYAIAAEEIFNLKVDRAAFMMIRTGKTIWHDVTEADKTRLKDDLLKASEQVAQMDLKVFPNFVMCGECPHAGECSRGNHWIIDAERMEVDW
jgi:hypothetical protein